MLRRSTRIRKPPLRLVMNMDDTIEHYDLEPVTLDLPFEINELIGEESEEDEILSEGTADVKNSDDDEFLSGDDDDTAFVYPDAEYTPSSESESESIDESDELTGEEESDADNAIPVA